MMYTVTCEVDKDNKETVFLRYTKNLTHNFLYAIIVHRLSVSVFRYFEITIVKIRKARVKI